ncbi:MAG TPA: hypothetical protein VFI03_12630 [Solirubrobacterales bacterium]|nr:hypothetical protein [Solirubrobacterales bacterium]
MSSNREHAIAVVNELLHRPSTEGQVAMTPTMTRCVKALERRSTDLVEGAHRAGVPIEYLGINPLFSRPRFYRGRETNWVLGPAFGGDDLVVPRRESRELRRLAEAHVEFPMIFIGHETEKEAGDGLEEGHELDREKAAELIGPIPPPAESIALGERFAERSNELMDALGRTVPALLGALKGPIDLAADALANLDPVVLGAIPALGGRPGEPAAWYALVRWDW